MSSSGVETAQSFAVPIVGVVEILAEFVELEGVDVPAADLLRLRAELPEAYPSLTVESGDDGLALVVTPHASSSDAVFTENAATGGLKLRFDGVVGELRHVDGGFRTDLRLTLLERLYHSRRWAVVAMVAAWLLATTFGVYKSWQELKAPGEGSETV